MIPLATANKLDVLTTANLTWRDKDFFQKAEWNQAAIAFLLFFLPQLPRGKYVAEILSSKSTD